MGPPTHNGSSDSEFTPRREFIKEQSQSSTFSLLSISSSNLVRLYSFPDAVVRALRRLFQQRTSIAAFREDVMQNMCEFTLDGKLWASSKSVFTECLLVEILCSIYGNGYSFLSMIDYGRENDDRVCMAFHAPSLAQSSPKGSGSSMTFPKNKKAPFALSFPSATTLRVICPPLDSTPAILQAVRSSWARGVLSERKVGNNTFEFKLKGYRWFQEDTFATDSLKHIFSLLSSLDAHSYSLLTSISLSNRSRVKDLWIFVGPASSREDVDGLYSPSPADFSQPTLSPEPQSPKLGTSPPHSPPKTHKRLATDPLSPPMPEPVHFQSGSEGNVSRPHHNSTSNVLRKAPPRAQVPVSAIQDGHLDEYRAELPSVISDDNQNMTGIGAGGPSSGLLPPAGLSSPLTGLPPPGGQSPDVFYSTTPFNAAATAEPITSSPPIAAPVPVNAAAMDGVLAMSREQVMASNHGVSDVSPSEEDREVNAPRSLSPPRSRSSAEDPAPLDSPESSHTALQPIDPSPSVETPGELLSPTAFRDSALSSSSDTTQEIPITWTGKDNASTPAENPVQQTTSSQLPSAEKPSMGRFDSNMPTIPGGWQPTPVEEKGNAVVEEQDSIKVAPTTPVHEIGSIARVPEISDAGNARKSEAGLVGVISPEEVPPLPTADQTPGTPGPGTGWVMVDVDKKGVNPKADTNGTTAEQQNPSGAGQLSESRVETNAIANGDGTPKAAVSSMSPAAKAIVMIDAVEASKSRNSPKSSDATSPSRMRRLFSMTRRDSMKGKVSSPNVSSSAVDGPVSEIKEGRPSTDSALAAQENASSNDKTSKSRKTDKPKSSFRQKLKLIGTPEASRNEDKRRSID